LTENAFRDVNIAFANELSLICDEIGINVWELITLANRHPRVSILQPGPGVGGHCIAVDPWFIVSGTPELARLIHTARQVNDGKPGWVIGKIKAACFDLATERGCSPSELTVACLGLAFKANIDDFRESPALGITTQLVDEHKGRLIVCEPHINQLPEALIGLELVPLPAALQLADVVVLLVDHDAFRKIDENLLRDKKVIDTRGIWSLSHEGRINP
jgi:UDP-N-acetyl-D-mannosaminuronic acid dehydrogenase